MKNILLETVFIVLVLFTATYLSAQSRGRVVIKDSPQVVADLICVGDLIDLNASTFLVSKKVKRIKIGNSPPPSESKDFSISLVREILKKEFPQIDINIHGPKIIRVTRATLDPTRIRRKKKIL